MSYTNYIKQLDQKGFAIIPQMYCDSEVSQICALLEDKKVQESSVPQTKNLFAIRELLNQVPELGPLLLNRPLLQLITEMGIGKHFISKSIYFDKPKDSNWFVGYHQDLTINVAQKILTPGFVNWTNKRGQIGVQPPQEFLEKTATLRIHLDDTDQFNGALRVLPKTNRGGIMRTELLPEYKKEVLCPVERGGVMLMKPLTMHASSRSTGSKSRRVIHLEICPKALPGNLLWKERMEIVNPTIGG